MADYIDRTKVFDAITVELYPSEWNEIIENIANIPSADAVEQKHGHWRYNDFYDMFVCTNCTRTTVRNDYPYCMWCGAKMDEEVEEDDG